MHICLHRATAGGGLPLEEFVALAAAAGFHGADVDLGYAQSRGVNALRDLYLSKHMRFGGWGIPFDWRGDAAKLDEGVKRLAALAKLAAELKIDSCGTWIMPSSQLRFLDNWKFHVDRLKPCAAALKEHGLRLALEFIGPYHHRTRAPHEFIFTPGQMLELAADIGDNAGLLVDLFHVFTSGTTMEHVARLDGKKIPWVHLNDAPDAPFQKQQDSHRLIPGEGILDISGFLDAIGKTGFDGPVSVEIFNADLKKLPPMEAAKKVWDGVRKSAPHYASARS